jgi:hypothetical protein
MCLGASLALICFWSISFSIFFNLGHWPKAKVARIYHPNCVAMVCPCSQLIYDPIMDNVDMLKKL